MSTTGSARTANAPSPRPSTSTLTADLKQIPLQLGDWQGEDVPQTNIEVFILLEPEQYVQRMYRLA